MSALQTFVRPDPHAVQVHLNRLHLLYRFDLQQRTWVLQALEIRSGLNSTFPAGFASLASAIAKNISDFSDPAPGGDQPAKTASRRTGIRQLFQRPLRTTKNQRKNEN